MGDAEEEEEEYQYLYKIVLIGDSGVGKSNLLSRFTKGHFNTETKPTIGVEIGSKTIKLQNKSLVKVQLWDTAGQERFRSIPSTYYRGSVGALVVFDITDRRTFENCSSWLTELKTYSDKNQVVLMLIGNKTDLRHLRTVSTEEAEDFAQRNNMAFIETSALDSTGVETAFEQMILEISQAISRKSMGVNDDSSDSNPNLQGGIKIENQGNNNSINDSTCC